MGVHSSTSRAIEAAMDAVVDAAVDVAVDADREQRRQRAVEALGLAEHFRDERFDRITRVTCTLLDALASTITVFDGDHAYYPGAAGYDGTPVVRNQTFCDQTADEDKLTIVPDARLDPRFSGLDAVLNGVVRFYAGAPLRNRLGDVVGVLCVFDGDTGDLVGDRLSAFEDLAAWAEQELLASSEMSAAAQAQASLLPHEPLQLAGWDVAGVCLPSLAVGGDFYDYGVDVGVLHLGLIDVMGKGIGAALVGAGIRAAMRGTHTDVVTGLDLGRNATRIARAMASDLDRAKSFATVFEAAIDLSDGSVRYVDAGLGLMLVVRADGRVERLPGGDRPFGILPDDVWSQQLAVLDPGDRLLVFSDGLLDLIDDQVRWWEPVGRLVEAHADTAGLLAHIVELAGAETALDDVTALAIHRCAGPVLGRLPGAA